MFVTDNLARRCIYLLFAFLTLVSEPASSDARIEQLGRLFTDPGQREKLDAIRHGNFGQQFESTSSVTDVTVNGVMLRSGGESVVWVNGQSTLDGSTGEGVNVRTRAVNKNNYSVPVEVDGRFIHMKPGQSWSDGSDAIKDNY